ncbi:hypothetical protein K469DRAFT_786845 [Zopfia rhizophila CBS 207.26]|uniref:Pal1-domain-containing protein n=1 Tax=Zopfia rhizophila CBS 207.26 TaxID=1314779 RepID=A0A6A6DXZ9_9PEZI|nr:hypothetical protein K469DRAFT_786845 [Zopfia rhizophila CBS 207.26]
MAQSDRTHRHSPSVPYEDYNTYISDSNLFPRDAYPELNSSNHYSGGSLSPTQCNPKRESHAFFNQGVRASPPSRSSAYLDDHDERISPEQYPQIPSSPHFYGFSPIQPKDGREDDRALRRTPENPDYHTHLFGERSEGSLKGPRPISPSRPTVRQLEKAQELMDADQNREQPIGPRDMPKRKPVPSRLYEGGVGVGDAIEMSTRGRDVAYERQLKNDEITEASARYPGLSRVPPPGSQERHRIDI